MHSVLSLTGKFMCTTDTLLHRNNAEIQRYPDWKRGQGESWGSFVYRLCTEGHTFFDAWLLAAGCIGQVGVQCSTKQR